MKLQINDEMIKYLEYAALIEGKTVKNFVAKIHRQIRTMHPSLKRVWEPQAFDKHVIVDVVRSYEAQNGLPRSTTYSRRPDALDRAYWHMEMNKSVLLNA
jgi:hypothetical protein